MQGGEESGLVLLHYTMAVLKIWGDELLHGWTEGHVYAFALGYGGKKEREAQASIDCAIAHGAGIIRIDGQAAELFELHPVLPWEVLARTKRHMGMYRTIDMGHLKIDEHNWDGNILVITRAHIEPHRGLALCRAWGRKLGRMVFGEAVPFTATISVAMAAYVTSLPLYLLSLTEAIIRILGFAALLLVPQAIIRVWIWRRAKIRGFPWQ
jgi:hypothetical protein